VGKMESHLFPYSLGEQQCPGSLRFNLPQIIRQRYRSMASPQHGYHGGMVRIRINHSLTPEEAQKIGKRLTWAGKAARKLGPYPASNLTWGR